MEASLGHPFQLRGLSCRMPPPSINTFFTSVAQARRERFCYPLRPRRAHHCLHTRDIRGLLERLALPSQVGHVHPAKHLAQPTREKFNRVEVWRLRWTIPQLDVPALVHRHAQPSPKETFDQVGVELSCSTSFQGGAPVHDAPLLQGRFDKVQKLFPGSMV